MNESLKNTQTILNQTDHGLGATRTLQEEVDKEEVAWILVPKVELVTLILVKNTCIH